MQNKITKYYFKGYDDRIEGKIPAKYPLVQHAHSNRKCLFGGSQPKRCFLGFIFINQIF
jgi:hypothetical protein